MSNEKLAAMLGVDEGTVAQWERNVRKPLRRIKDMVDLLLKTNAAR